MKPDNIKIISGERLRQIRKEKKLSQEKFAELIDSCPQTVSYIENGKRPLSLKMARKIISVFQLDLDIDYLLGTQDYPNEKIRLRNTLESDIDIGALFIVLLERLGYKQIAFSGSITGHDDSLERYRFFLSQEDFGKKLNEILKEIDTDNLRVRRKEYLFSTPYGELCIDAERYHSLKKLLKKQLIFLIEYAFCIDVIKESNIDTPLAIKTQNNYKKDEILHRGKALSEEYNCKGYWQETMTREAFLAKGKILEDE